MGTLYLVATPIGNLEDMSPRAIRILGEVRLIAAEDTRVTRKLLTRFNIHTPQTSYFEHNKLTKQDLILSALAEGDVALVSDAGTPCINDPGVELVGLSLEAGHTICPIPGPSAPIAALVASGLPTASFLYLGYLPRRASTRRESLDAISTIPHTLIFLETPHRLLVSLRDLVSILGDRSIAVARELTKVHEEIWRGTISGAVEYFTRSEPRGEFTLVISGFIPDASPKWSEDKVILAVKVGLKLAQSPAALAKQIARESGWERKDVYRLITMNKGKHGSG